MNYKDEFKDVKDTQFNDRMNYIFHLVEIGHMDADEAIHEIKELRDIYKV